MPDTTPLQQARENIAARYKQTYTINAILAGDWDTGSLVREERIRIEEERRAKQ